MDTEKELRLKVGWIKRFVKNFMARHKCVLVGADDLVQEAVLTYISMLREYGDSLAMQPKCLVPNRLRMALLKLLRISEPATPVNRWMPVQSHARRKWIAALNRRGGMDASDLSVEPKDIGQSIDLRAAMSALSPREQAVVRMMKSGMSLAEIGREFSVSREAVRQTKCRALDKLKRILKDYES